MPDFDPTAFADSAIESGGGVGLSGASESLTAGPDFSANLSFDLGSLGGMRDVTQSAFVSAIQRGADTSQANLYAVSSAVGELTGLDGIQEWGEEGYVEQMKEAAMNPAHVESYEDIEGLADIGTFVAEAIGENAINLLTMATGAGLGVTAVKAGIGKAALQHMGKAAAKKRLALGAAGGNIAANYPLSAGEVAGEFLQEGVDAPGTALLAGIPIAGLDMIGFNKMMGVAFKGMPIRNAKQLVTQAAKAFGSTGTTEFTTEAAQELVGMVARSTADPSFELFTDENRKRLLNAGFKGLAAGGTIGGVGSTISGLRAGVAEASAEAADNAKDFLSGVLDPEGGPQAPVTPASTGLVPTEDQFASGDLAGAFGVEGVTDPGLDGVLGDLAAKASRGEDVFTPESQEAVDRAFEAREIKLEDIDEKATVRVKVDVEGQQVEVDMPAREAVGNVDKELDAYTQLRRCLSS